MLDDPDAPTIYRVSGEAPFPDPALPSIPMSVIPRQVILRDRQTVATIVPFASRYQVPDSLLRYLNDQFNKEIEGGDTYPMMEGLPFEKFSSYWFQNFGAIMLLGNIESADEIIEGKDWSKECLGTFYIKPNYPGRSSHVCNAGFIVTDASRGRGVGRLMGEAYLDWAPKLGYTYSVFNLVYETNVASCKIWDALGFKRIGRVKGCGNLKSYPDRLIDAIIYGRELGDDGGNGASEDLVSEERFDKIKFYLKYGRYPNGADRAEKSRLRSAATHYKLLEGDVLMLKDKEVIADPQRQFEIARQVHNQSHAGINKTTAIIAERYHWSRIKETVSDVIRNCPECKELSKTQNNILPVMTSQSNIRRSNHLGAPSNSVTVGSSSSKRSSPGPSSAVGSGGDVVTPGPRSLPSLTEPSHLAPFTLPSHAFGHANDISIISPSHTLQTSSTSSITDPSGVTRHNPMLQGHSPLPLPDPHVYHPIDPQIISQPSTHAHHHTLHHYPFHHSPHPHDPDTDTFQALLNATDDDVDPGLHSHSHHHDHHSASQEDSHHTDSHDADQAAVYRDLEMLIEQPQDDEDDATGTAGATVAGTGVVDDPMHVDIPMSGSAGVSDEPGKTGTTSKMDVSHLLSSPPPGEDDDDDDPSGGRDGDVTRSGS
jgi:GNAT superfamily N-acetyltransferase